MTEVLSDDEKRALRLTAELVGLFGQIIGHGRSRHGDLGEVVDHIHALQHMLMSQAAARSYPTDYRLLGETLSSGE